ATAGELRRPRALQQLVCAARPHRTRHALANGVLRATHAAGAERGAGAGVRAAQNGRRPELYRAPAGRPHRLLPVRQLQPV
nr:hypothetical protein [Tanacetum cinerariifolium]